MYVSFMRGLNKVFLLDAIDQLKGAEFSKMEADFMIMKACWMLLTKQLVSARYFCRDQFGNISSPF